MTEQGYINVSVHTNIDDIDTGHIQRMACRPMIGDYVQVRTKKSPYFGVLKICRITHYVNSVGEPRLEIELT